MTTVKGLAAEPKPEDSVTLYETVRDALTP
jgi:hypothetical protein